jgi:hypothetical protein
LVQTFVKADFKTSGFAYEIFGFCIALFLLVMIYRRKNWARWIFAGCVIIWLAALISHFRTLTELTIAGGFVLVVQLMLWMAAAFMLFVRASSDWFRAQKSSA